MPIYPALCFPSRRMISKALFSGILPLIQFAMPSSPGASQLPIPPQRPANSRHPEQKHQSLNLGVLGLPLLPTAQLNHQHMQCFPEWGPGASPISLIWESQCTWDHPPECWGRERGSGFLPCVYLWLRFWVCSYIWVCLGPYFSLDHGLWG